MESETTSPTISPSAITANIVNPIVQQLATTAAPASAAASTQCIPPAQAAANVVPPPSVVTIPVPIVHNEGYYAYVTIKGSLHDRSCLVFGLNDAEVQALAKRFGNSVNSAVNGVMISASPMTVINTLAQLSYKVVCSCGEAEICWTMQREL